MPSINLKLEVYSELQGIMAYELKQKLTASNSKEAMLEIIKNKFGVTFNTMIFKLVNEYKKTHNIR